jgi:hypothetical protein
LTFGGLADCVNIGKILGTPSVQLCGDEVGSVNEKRLAAGIRLDRFFSPAFPCAFEIDARNCRENVIADRLSPDAEEWTGFCKSLSSHRCWCTSG